jgi:hypothetical protein
MLTNGWRKCRIGELDGGLLLLLRKVLKVLPVLGRELVFHEVNSLIRTYKPGLLEQPTSALKLP